MTGALEVEGPVGGCWGGPAVEGAEAVRDQDERQVALWAAGWASRLSDSTTEPRHHCQDVLVLLNATSTQDTRPIVRHRTRWHYCRGVTRTAAVSDAASAAAASAVCAAPGDWRTSSRRTRLRSRRTPVPGRRGHLQAAGGDQLQESLQSFGTGVPHNCPRMDTLFKKLGGDHGLCAGLSG